jgi:acetyl-CoA synthetase
MADKAIEILLDERRNFPPPKEFKKSAHVRSASILNSARKNPQVFWAKAARELHWFKPWKKVLEWKSPWGSSAEGSTPLTTAWIGMSKC